MSKYKNGDTLEFKGLTYRYDEEYGEWHLKTRVNKDIPVPLTIFSYKQAGGAEDVWHTGNYEHAPTPVGALRAWTRDILARKKLATERAKLNLSDAKLEQSLLKSTQWAAPARKKKAKKKAKKKRG